jgi:putative membrane protein
MKDLYATVEVRDGLAAERTLLAAERTFLAYFRTALAMLVAGITGVRLILEPVLIVVSYVLAGSGLFVLSLGVVRLVLSRRATRRMLVRLIEDRRQT